METVIVLRQSKPETGVFGSHLQWIIQTIPPPYRDKVERQIPHLQHLHCVEFAARPPESSFLRRLEQQCPYIVLAVCLATDSWSCLCQAWARNQLG